jgi:hypothetical protein
MAFLRCFSFIQESFLSFPLFENYFVGTMLHCMGVGGTGHHSMESTSGVWVTGAGFQGKTGISKSVEWKWKNTLAQSLICFDRCVDCAGGHVLTG